MYKIKVIFGEEQSTKYDNKQPFTIDEINTNFETFVFDTQVEINAFKKGLEACYGWNAYRIIE